MDDMEDFKVDSVMERPKAKIFICDRRRAILEGVSTMIPMRLPRTPKNSESSGSGLSSSSSLASTSSSDSGRGNKKTKSKSNQTFSDKDLQNQHDLRRRNISDRTQTSSTSTDSSGIHSKATTFISDQYNDVNDPNWAFAFKFNSWLQDFTVEEVYFKNFCSFLEREKLEDPITPSSYKGRTALYERMCQQGSSTVSALDSCQIVKLTCSAVEEMSHLSAGRIERLAQSLSKIREAHFVFKDAVCYGARPPVTFFYFLSMMHRNTRSLTFDHIQAATQVQLHEVLNMSNLQRLTIIQPEQHACISVTSETLTNWMALPLPFRKRISIHLTGCHEFKPKEMCTFVGKWIDNLTVAVFKQISIDGGSYKYNEFMNILEAMQDVVEKRPPRTPPVIRSFDDDTNEHSVVLNRVFRMAHPKDRSSVIQLKYCKASRRMVLTVERELNPVPVKNLSPVSTFTRLARPHSAAAVITTPIRKISSSLKPSVTPIPTNQAHKIGRPLSHDAVHIGCRENAGSSGSSIFNRFMGFLATSS